ncbi:MAG: hypothetical protein ACI8QD_000085 [Cyclobacteriaceae bacterium]|jgi:hypothetical protein
MVAIGAFNNFSISKFSWSCSDKFRWVWGDSISRLEKWKRREGGLVYPGNYDDQSKGKGSSIASVQSDIIDRGILKLFIVADIKVEGLIKEYVKYDSMSSAQPQMFRRDMNLATIEKFYRFYIDDSLKLDYELLFHYNTATEQKGCLAYVYVSYLQRDLHKLKLAPSPTLIGEGA